MIQQALKNEMWSRGRKRIKIATIVTQVLVDNDDPAFALPTKPIGSFMEEATARLFAEQGWHVVEDAGRGWRRVVASPKPKRVIEEETIRDLIASGTTVITAGGGGIPVVHNHKGELREMQGVQAVIDKDRASSLLARQLNVDLFLISTGVERVSLHYNTPQQVDLAQVTTAELTQHLHAGHFAPGSMLPKVEAVLNFVNKTGNPAIITNPPNLARALQQESGTRVVKE
jgi:carbamate kinase